MEFPIWMPFFFCALSNSVLVTRADFVRVCYFASWAARRGNAAAHDIEDIDPHLCTHLIYAFGALELTNGELIIGEHSSPERFRQFNLLKEKNSGLKTLISVGGENERTDAFEKITRSDENVEHFTNSTVQFLRDHKFDGIDIDWEFPDARTRSNLSALLKSLREAFDQESTDPDQRWLLTLAGAAGQGNIDAGYNVSEIAQYVDFVSLLTYDYTMVSNAEFAAFNSPLYSRQDIRFNHRLNTNWTVHYWNQKGLPFEKTVVGVTGVGRLLVLENSMLSTPGSPVTQDVREGTLYLLPAGLAYPEICIWLSNISTVQSFDDEQKNPYFVNEDNWVGYEDERSLKTKLEWMQDLGVRGLMFWALDQDDFSGQFCGNGKYPLLSTVTNITQGTSTSTSANITQDLTTTTTSAVTTDVEVETASTPTTPMESTTTATTTTTTRPSTTTKTLARKRTVSPNNSGRALTQSSSLQIYSLAWSLCMYKMLL